jgi:hypothetical protein
MESIADPIGLCHSPQLGNAPELVTLLRSSRGGRICNYGFL